MKRLLAVLLLIVACQSNVFALKPTQKLTSKHNQKVRLKYPPLPPPDSYWHDSPADRECNASMDPTVDPGLNCAKRARVKL